MATEDDLFKIRTELATDRFSKMYDKGCYSYNGHYLCTGIVEMVFSHGKFVTECTTCGDQIGFESKNYQAEVERIYLLKMIDQPNNNLVAL